MIPLYDKKNGALIGEISDRQLEFLVAQLEEESLEDRDYAITSMTLDYFQSQGADQELLSLLRGALGTKDEITILWKTEAD